ncbi:MAG: GFA family protein [bacterium]
MSEPVRTGRCVCEDLRYRLAALPLFTHACHCLDCQRRTGTAFSMTTIVIRDELAITQGEMRLTQVSPRRTVHACASCETPIFTASTAFPATVTLRPGTLDDTRLATPGAHIWVRRKQAWLILPDDVPQFDEQYDRETTWPEESLARFRAANEGHGHGARSS